MDRERIDKLVDHLMARHNAGTGYRIDRPLGHVAAGILAAPQAHVDALVEAGVLEGRRIADGPWSYMIVQPEPWPDVAPEPVEVSEPAPDMRNLPEGTRVLYEGSVYQIGNACTRGVDGTDLEQTRYRLVSQPTMFAPTTYCWASHDEIQLVVDTAKVEEVPA